MDQARRPAAAIATALLLVCTALAVTRPLIPYDSWLYHLPFASRLWNIGGGADSFHPDSVSMARWQGFPKAWEWLQGLAWAATGSLRAIILPQLLLCAAWFALLSRTRGIPLHWLILGFFASPMLLIHFEAVYLDLPAGLSLAIGFFLLLDLLDADRPFRPWCAAAAVAAIGLAGNIKYQSLLAALCIVAIAAVLALALRGLTARRRAVVLAVLLASVLLAGATSLVNLARTGNPFYPVAVQFRGTTLFPGPENDAGGAAYPSYLLTDSHEIRLPEPVNFVLSATELDWTLRGVAPWYNVDSVTGLAPRRGAPSRTGGWGALFVLANAGLLAWQLLRLRRQPDRHQRVLVIAGLLLLVVTACLPRAHELRYWLHLPLVLLPINLRYLRGIPHVSPALLAMAAYGVALAVLSPKSDLFTARLLTPAAARADMPPAISAALSRTGRYCGTDELLFRYSQPVTALPGLLSRNPADCPP